MQALTNGHSVFSDTIKEGRPPKIPVGARDVAKTIKTYANPTKGNRRNTQARSYETKQKEINKVIKQPSPIQNRQSQSPG